MRHYRILLDYFEQKKKSAFPVVQECGLDVITPESLYSKGLVSKGALVKVLARGELTRKVTVSAHGFSKSAEAAITAAGGSTEIVSKPFGVRPAFHGSAHTNR